MRTSLLCLAGCGSTVVFETGLATAILNSAREPIQAHRSHVTCPGCETDQFLTEDGDHGISSR